MITALLLSPALDVTYLLDAIELGEIHRPREVHKLAGGKALNLARAAAVLGERVRVVAPLGGHTGALVAELATAAGLDIDTVSIAGETRTCVSVIPDTGAPTEFYEAAVPLGLADWSALGARLAAAPTRGWTVVAGSLPGSVDIAALSSLLRARRDAGDRIAVDTSGAGAAALVEAVRPELLKLNREEAIALLAAGADDDGAAEQLAALLHQRTGGTVVVTDGAAGAVAVDASGIWRAHPDPQPGRYAIGSGDSFLAGFLVALERGAPLDAALGDASAAGSANTRVPGAGIFDRAAFDDARARIHVEAS